jgi:hypothetical protein
MLNRILSAFFIGFGFLAVAQVTSTSPYSYYGLGEMEGMENATFGALGNSTITYFDSTVLNYNNPASYNTLGKGQPIFSTGLSSRMSNYYQGEIKNFNKSVTLNHFAFGLSFGKYFGVAVGLKPYSRRGYNFYDLQGVGSDTLKHSYSGEGNTNEAFIGFSTDLIHLKKIRLSVGSNIGYVFGNISNTRMSNLVGSDSSSGGVYITKNELKAIHYQFGMNYNQKLNEQNELSVSAVYEPTQDFFGYQSNTMYYAPLISNPLSYVTLTATGLVANHFKVAPTTTLGLNYRFQFTDIKKGNQSRKSEISVHASFNTTDWTKFKSISEGVEKDYHFQATTKTTIGLQYSPEIFNNDKAANGNILEKTKYRFGAYSYNLPFTQNNLNIVDKGLTIGLGIPILTQRSQSSVNLGFAYGNRETSDKTLLTEKYYSINIGLTFAPSIFERWFVKRKLD